MEIQLCRGVLIIVMFHCSKTPLLQEREGMSNSPISTIVSSTTPLKWHATSDESFNLVKSQIWSLADPSDPVHFVMCAQ